MDMLEIEKELSGPGAQEALMKYDSQLVNLGNRLKQALDAGMAPEEFSRCTQLAEAVTVARKLLRLQIQK